MTRKSDDEYPGPGVDDGDSNGPVEHGSESTDSALYPRPAPPGMTRKDRKLWRELEGERLAAAVQARRSMDGYRGGFPASLPGQRGRGERRLSRRLGRQGWKTFRHADRANRAQWWANKRSEGEADRAPGAILIVLVLVIGVILWRVFTRDTTPASSTPPAATAASSAAGSSTTSDAPVSLTTASTNGTAPTGSTPAANTSASGRATGTTPAPRTTTGAGSPTPVTESGVFGNGTNTSTAPATATITPRGVITVVPEAATVAPDPGPVAAVPAAARKDAITAGRAWFTVTCGSAWSEKFGSRFVATRAAMTAEGWAYADPARDVRGKQWWESVVIHKETRTCSRMKVARFAGPAPAGPNQVPVLMTAERQVTSGVSGTMPRLESISELRMMVRGADGQWSVGPVVLAG